MDLPTPVIVLLCLHPHQGVLWDEVERGNVESGVFCPGRVLLLLVCKFKVVDNDDCDDSITPKNRYPRVMN